MAHRVLGAVLAGGRSSRFGSDKAAATWKGRSLAEHAAALIAQHVDRVVTVGPGDIPDLPEPGLGPLGGIAGALDHAAGQGFTSVLTIGCDKTTPAALMAATRKRTGRARGRAQANPYSLSFLRKVARWMPSIAAARLWLPSQWLRISTNSGISISRSTIS